MPINQLNVDQCSHFLQYLGLPDRRQSWFKKGIRPLDGKLLSLLKDEQDLLDFYPKKKVPRLVLREVAQRLKEEFIPKGVSKSLVGNDTTEKVPLHQQDILVPVSNFKVGKPYFHCFIEPNIFKFTFTCTCRMTTKLKNLKI